MNVQIADTDSEILSCYPVMRELRPDLAESGFVARVRRQQRSGYQLVFAEVSGAVVAVAGLRIGENLAWGRFLYVDDLVTLESRRSNGYGTKLLSWLRDYAVRMDCGQLHLDSGVQRRDAHRFYEREGMVKTGYHFAEMLASDSAS